MGSIALEPASRWSFAELAELFTASYEGYFMPVQLDEAAFAAMASASDFDLDASRVALDGDERVGLCNLGVRGEDAWIGGVGVVAGRRGEGIGTQLMHAAHDAARARGVRRVWLEVLVQNEPAIRLYERLGYERVRELEVWTLGELELRKHKGSPVPVAEALGRSGGREPWQRSDASVANLEGVEALAGERGAIVYRSTGGVVSLLQGTAEDEPAARELLESLPAGTTGVRWLNGPVGDPFNAAFASLGGAEVARQHEYVLTL
jgi:ribosomal protein S18 acetylase RimI-like enzyme